MIHITDFNGRSHYLAPEAVARVSEADVSSRWHGTKSIVRTFDGLVIECGEEAKAVAQKVEFERLAQAQCKEV